MGIIQQGIKDSCPPCQIPCEVRSNGGEGPTADHKTFTDQMIPRENYQRVVPNTGTK